MSLNALGLFSLVSFVLTLVLVPVLLIGLPADHFCRDGEQAAHRRHPLLHALLVFSRNAAGIMLLGLGVVLLVLPGQGLLTMLLGLVLMDFPGKRGLERRLLRQPRVLQPLNRLRRRFGRAPLRLPGSD